MIIAIIIVTIILRTIYHKIFNVVYFSFYAVLKEWATCFLIAAILCTAILG